jgi:hypothetical protein
MSSSKMTLKEDVQSMIDKILDGDKSIDVIDIVKLINKYRGK